MVQAIFQMFTRKKISKMHKQTNGSKVKFSDFSQLRWCDSEQLSFKAARLLIMHDVTTWYGFSVKEKLIPTVTVIKWNYLQSPDQAVSLFISAVKKSWAAALFGVMFQPRILTFVTVVRFGFSSCFSWIQYMVMIWYFHVLKNAIMWDWWSCTVTEHQICLTNLNTGCVFKH